MVLGLSKVYGGQNAHAVIVYGIDDDKGHLQVYDPNYPGEKRVIIFNKSQKKFESYMGEDKIAPFSTGSIYAQPEFEKILLDAKINFHSSTMPVITISSPQNNSTLGVFTVTLRGHISSAEVLVEKIFIYIGGAKHTAPVNLNGDFSIPVALKRGENHLLFETYGRNSNEEFIKISPTNMDTQRYTLHVDAPSAAILMTLTWDTNDTDMDIYVIDPTGDYSCFYHPRTNDGGELDRDDIDGFGPEHWTLMDSDIKRFGQPYRLRVHYYDDNGHGGSNYKVTVTIHQGTAFEKNYFYEGYIGISDAYNDDPTDTGQDWKDLAYIRLNSSARSSTVDEIDGSNIFSSIENIQINSYIPPKDMREK